MEKYAIIQIDGKQYKVKEGLEIRLNKQSELNIDVLLYSDGKTVELGNPFVNVPVKAKIVGEERAPKILVGRFKSKSRYKKTKGHRQPLSVVKIESIGAAVKETTKKSTKVKAKAKATKSSKK